MTAAHPVRRLRPATALQPPTLDELRAAQPRLQVNWAAIGAVMAIVVHATAAIWFAAQLDRRVLNIEQQLPPGAIAKLDERSLQQQQALVEIRDSLRTLERRP